MDNHTTTHDDAQQMLDWADKVATGTHELVLLTASEPLEFETLAQLCNLMADAKADQQAAQWMAIDTATEFLERAKVKSTSRKVRQVLLKFEAVVDNYQDAILALALAGAATTESGKD